MVLPWGLIARLVLGLLVGAAVLAARGARRSRMTAALDLSVSLALGAVIGGRLLVVGLDAVLVGALPDLRAVLSLGPGLSVPGSLIGAVVAGRRGHDRTAPTWRDTAVAVTAGLAGFSAAHLPGNVAGNGVRVVAFAAAAWWLSRADLETWSAGARVLSAVAAVHLLAGTVTPSLPTVDADVDVLLTLAVLLGALLTHPRVAAGTRRLVGVVGLAIGGLVLVSVLAAGPAGTGEVEAARSASLSGAILAGSTATDVPAWGAAELSALVRDAEGPVVVNLWAAWCPPCHAEAPAVDRAAHALRGRATVIGVLVDDGVEDGQAFADRYGLRFPTVSDAGLSDHLGMTGLPTTVILDRHGDVVSRVVGGLGQGALAQAITEAETR